ncbi:MAG: EI24 domain-containing protein [Myxococcota bacterium]
MRRTLLGMSSMRTRFMAGLSASWGGLKAGTRSAGVRRTYLQMVLALFLVSAVLDVAGIWAVLHWTDISTDAAWYTSVGLWIARILGILIVLLAAPLLSLTVVNLVFPFLGERVFLASMRGVNPARAEQLAAAPGLPIMPSVWIQVRRLVTFVGMTLLVFLLSLLPVVGQVLAPVLQGYVSSRGLAWELLDPYFDKLGLRYAEQKAVVSQHGASMVGFGLPLTFVMAIPLAGPLFFGLAQAAAAQLVTEVIEAPTA